MAFWFYLCLFAALPLLFQGEIISALLGVMFSWWGYRITFAGGVMFLNVFGVIAEVVDVNARESQAIRRKE